VPLEELVFSALTTGSPLTGVGDRIYPDVAPEDDETYPRIVYGRAATEHQNALGGFAGLARVTMQFDIWARTRLETITVHEQLHAALDGQSFKPLPGSVYDSFEGESRLYRRTVEFSCWDKSLPRSTTS
jgi:Protein of unknown function (DUF3168)